MYQTKIITQTLLSISCVFFDNRCTLFHSLCKSDINVSSLLLLDSSIIPPAAMSAATPVPANPNQSSQCHDKCKSARENSEIGSKSGQSFLILLKNTYLQRILIRYRCLLVVQFDFWGTKTLFGWGHI